MPFSPEILRPCWVLAGPTAVGKSAVALELAERLGAEILGLDSMTLYRGLEIGTAKPSPEDRSRVPHHLFDLLAPDAEFSIAEYLQAAEQACRDILARGKIPLFVGGTGLYLRGLLRGLFEGPCANWEIRQRLEQREQTAGPGTLHRDLQQVDPTAALALHPNDQRRVIRALEVFELTGKPLSVQQQEAVLPPEDRPQHVYWLRPPRDWLYARIDQRVLAMFAAGLVEEVQNLLAQPAGLGRTASQALGYQEVAQMVRGELTREQAITLIQTRTRQFAKRQHTWFGNLAECHAIEIQGTESAGSIASLLLARSPSS